LKAMDKAVLGGGAAIALLAGVASAELALAPLRQALAAQPPSLDTTIADAPLAQPDLVDPAQRPPAVVVPISARVRADRASPDSDDSAANTPEPAADEAPTPVDNVATRDDQDTRGGDQDSPPPVTAPDAPSEDPPATTLG